MATESYAIAREKYAEIGVDTDAAIAQLAKVPLSIHCWQGDDVGGFEKPGAALDGGGIQVTGSFPGKARTIQELRSDLERLFALLPGRHRLALHGSYGEFGDQFVDRDAIECKHFTGWVQWAQGQNLGLDFNSTYFSHPLAESGFTLSSKDHSVRTFWIEHGKRCREISAYMGRELGSACIHNVWIPDGTKDYPIDRLGHRQILVEALDDMFSKPFSPEDMKDAVEAKLFGIGSEAYVVGSHEFYLGYAVSRKTVLCIDMGHFHPTETVADKISAALLYVKELLLHVSRPMRWDSDHVVLLDDNLRLLCEEIVRSNRLQDIHVGLDFFDGSINRLGAWTIGSRSTLQGLLLAFLQPYEVLLQYEQEERYYERLALLEGLKTMPFGSVWEHYCESSGAPTDAGTIDAVIQYERSVLAKRN